MDSKQKYTCPCCGYKTIDREDTFYDLCPVCHWETDPIQFADPYYGGGANRVSLIQAQQNFIAFKACEKCSISSVRPPLEDEIKGENWTIFPIDIKGSFFYKRFWHETTGDVLTNHRGTSAYYFEATYEGEVLKQIEEYGNGKVLKYSSSQLEDEFGGLSKVPLDLEDEQFFSINKDTFFALWDKPISNTFLIEEITVSDKWNIGEFYLKQNQTEAELKKQQTILKADLGHRFILDLTYEDHAKYLLEIKEGNTWIHYFTYPLWREAATATNKWLGEIEEVAKTIDIRKIEETKAFNVRVNIDNTIVSAKLTTWRNMDWDVEKFRNIQIEIRDETYSIIDTFTDFENMLIALQKSLPENYKIEICFFCRFSGYMVAGNDNFGDLDCFKKCKNKFVEAIDKHTLIELYESEKDATVKVEETDYCEEFIQVKAEDWVYKNQIR
jgi:Cysteine-rich CPCC